MTTDARRAELEDMARDLLNSDAWGDAFIGSNEEIETLAGWLADAEDRVIAKGLEMLKGYGAVEECLLEAEWRKCNRSASVERRRLGAVLGIAIRVLRALSQSTTKGQGR